MILQDEENRKNDEDEDIFPTKILFHKKSQSIFDSERRRLYTRSTYNTYEVSSYVHYTKCITTHNAFHVRHVVRKRIACHAM